MEMLAVVWCEGVGATMREARSAAEEGGFEVVDVEEPLLVVGRDGCCCLHMADCVKGRWGRKREGGARWIRESTARAERERRGSDMVAEGG